MGAPAAHDPVRGPYPPSDPPARPPSRGQDPVYHWIEEPALRIGEEVFKLFHVSNTDGRERVLLVSRDDCWTWQKDLQ
jgi:hypothetical protein